MKISLLVKLVLSLLPLQTHSAISKYFFLNFREKRGEVGSFKDYFLPIFVIALRKKFLVEIKFYIGSLERLQLVFELVDDILDSLFTLVSNPDMDEFFVGRIGKSFSFRKRMNEEIPIIPFGDVPDEI